MADTKITLTIGADQGYTFVLSRPSGATTVDAMTFEATDANGAAIASLAKSIGSGITASEVGDNVEGSITFDRADTLGLTKQTGSYKLWLVEDDGKWSLAKCGQLRLNEC